MEREVWQYRLIITRGPVRVEEDVSRRRLNPQRAERGVEVFFYLSLLTFVLTWWLTR
ncbi:MAG: hypothetical protein QJR13_00495 [Bacillota bacterium]|nr:hypothetical protein [Bacillota bacterium]